MAIGAENAEHPTLKAPRRIVANRLQLTTSALSLCGSLAVLVAAPGAVAGPTAFSAKVGAVHSDQDWDFPSQFARPTSGRWGGALGAALDWILLSSSRFSLTTDLLYMRKGFKESVPESGNGAPFVVRTRSVDYLSLAVSPKWSVSRTVARPYLLAGLSFDFRTHTDELAGLDELDRFVLGGHVGAGFDWRSLLIEIRYMHDLTSSADSGSVLRSVKNQGLLMLIGVRLDDRAAT